jgi:hypothetical protein
MMIKIFLAAILFIHGIIHLIGFMRAFAPEKVKIEGRPVGKPLGLLWLLTVVMFLISFVLWLFKNPNWSVVALIVVAVSQFLIITYWKEAKFGTIANVIILIWAWPHYGSQRFEKMLQSEWDELKSGVVAPKNDTIREEQLKDLPYIVQKWLRQSGTVGNPSISHAYIRQRGNMILEAESTQKFDFEGIEYFDIKQPSFIWSTKVYYASWLPLTVRDKWVDGEGAMLVKLLHVAKVVNAKADDALNKASAIRFLGEMCWMPSAALEPYVQWQEIDSVSALATLTYKEKSYSGTFFFSEDGKVETFEALRQFGTEKDAKEYPWQVVVQEHDTFKGYTIPSRCMVTWKLPSGNFTWMELKITDMLVNRWPESRM